MFGWRWLRTAPRSNLPNHRTRRTCRTRRTSRTCPDI